MALMLVVLVFLSLHTVVISHSSGFHYESRTPHYVAFLGYLGLSKRSIMAKV
jgi:hypothetical protein